MTEVWEEKEKIGSVNIEHEEKHKHRAGKNAQKDATMKKAEVDERICHLCGRVFKNYRALKIHGRHCKGMGARQEKERKNEEENIEMGEEIEDDDVVKLREKLMYELKAIKEERMKMEEERYAFRADMRKELEKLREVRMDTETKIRYGLTPTSDTRGKDESDITAEEEIEGAGLKDHGATGVVVLEVEEEAGDEEGIDEMEEELAKIEPEVAGMGEGISAIELEELSAELETIESELNTKVDFAALTRMSEDYEQAIKGLEDSIATLDKKIDGVIEGIEDSAKKYGTYHNMIRELGRLDEKTTEILEEIGFGESLNVAKIPPNILESVYESTLTGAVSEIRRNYGSHDAENIITRTLEDVRTRTSGSELFYFNGRMLKTRNLANAIERKLISAKQVQTTYDEILSKLIEYLPGYKARNFRAMIKLKSQEYAVDKTTFLLENIDVLREHIDNLKNMVGSVSNRQNTIEIEINRMRESKVGKEDIEPDKALFEEVMAKQGVLDEMLRTFKEEQNAEKNNLSKELEDISKRLEELETSRLSERKKVPAQRPEKKVKNKEDRKKTLSGIENGLSEDEKLILTIVPSKGYTLSRIKKEIGDEMTNERIEECLQSMMNKRIMSTTKRGRHTVYMENKKVNGGEE